MSDGKISVREKIKIMAAVDLITREFPVMKERIQTNHDAINCEKSDRYNEDEKIRTNYVGKFDMVFKKLDILNGRLWAFIITVVSLFITASAMVIISNLSGK